MATEKQDLVAQAKQSLERMQNFDVEALPREAALGEELNFRDGVGSAVRLIALYRRMSLASLEDMPESVLQKLKQRADADYNIFQQILDFKATAPNAPELRRQVLASLSAAYEQAFNVLSSWISYSASVSIDFQRLESDGRAALQAVRDEGESLTEELAGFRNQALGILEEVRKVAAEQGVSQQASYFKSEADQHQSKGEKWRVRTYQFAALLGLYSVWSFFIHKIDYFRPSTTYDAVQLVASKVLVFGVLSYLVFLAARAWHSNEHNAIVNRHRQNALLTFRALVAAAKADGSQDIVLNHAAACIFSPQDSGFSRAGASEGQGMKVMELLPRPTVRIAGGEQG